MLVIGVDPDTRGTGLALIEDKGEGRPVVLKCGVVPSPSGVKGIVAVEYQIQALKELLPSFPSCDIVAAEYPQSYHGYYPRGRPSSKVDPNHLIMLAAVTGAASALVSAGRVSLLRPAEWKGQTPKGASHRQICRVLGWKWEQSSRNAKTPLRDVRPARGVEILGWGGEPSKHWSEVLDACGVALYEIKKRKGAS